MAGAGGAILYRLRNWQAPLSFSPILERRAFVNP